MNQLAIQTKERKETMDCNKDVNNISSADKSEVSQSKVSSDISQGIKNISDEMIFGQKVNDTSLNPNDHGRCIDHDESNYIIAKKLKSDKSSFLIYDSNTSSTTTSHKKASNKKSGSDYDNALYNIEIFKQVSLENSFNMLKEKYKKANVQNMFSSREIEISIAHIVSKVKELTVVAYAEDQQIRIEDVAGAREKQKKRGWSDDDSSTNSDKFSSESDSDDGSPYGRKPRPPQQEIKWYDRLTSDDTTKLVTSLMNNHVWNFGDWIRKIYPECKRTNEHICSFCPFNKEFHPYFEASGVMHLIRKYDLECTSRSKSICYSANSGLKQHCMNKQEDFGHKMLLYIIKELFEGKPTRYGPIVATKNVIELQNTFENDKKKKVFHVKR